VTYKLGLLKQQIKLSAVKRAAEMFSYLSGESVSREVNEIAFKIKS